MSKGVLQQFRQTIRATLEQPLASYGFEIESDKTEEHSCVVTFGNGALYVRLRATTHALDYPPHLTIALGEGSRDFMESEWNAVALWQLKSPVDASTDWPKLHLKDARQNS